MPLFMMLSGYTFCWSCQKRSFYELVVKRVKEIGIPLLIWSIISAMLLSLFNKPTSGIAFIKTIYNETMMIWFLRTILIVSVFVGLVYKATFKVEKYFLMVLMFIPLCMMKQGRNFNLFMYPFFVLGFLENDLKFGINKISRKPKEIWVYGIFWLVLLALYRERDYIYTSGIWPFDSEYGIWMQIVIDIFRYLIGIVGCILVIKILQWLLGKLENTRCVCFVEEIGKKSLSIYLTQRIVLEIIIAKICNKYPVTIEFLPMGNKVVYSVLLTPLLAVILCMLLMKVVNLFSKNKVIRCVLFGK